MRRWTAICLVAGLAFTACKEGAATYEVRGVVREVHPEKNTVVVRHEEVPNLMPAMTMPLKVKDPQELRDLAPGVPIRFTLHSSKTEMWISKVVRLPQPPKPPAPPAPPEATTPAVAAESNENPEGFRRFQEPLEEGDPVPNFTFTNQEGKTVSLHDFKGKVVALNFIFTRCPEPDFCPFLSRQFMQVQASPPPELGTNWHLLSVTLDPDFDTPERLKQYGRTYQSNPAHWSFLNAGVETVMNLGELFGLRFAPKEFPISHNLRTVVINPEGRLHKLIIGNGWPASVLKEQMAEAAKNRAAAP
jgi:protein SCO1